MASDKKEVDALYADPFSDKPQLPIQKELANIILAEEKNGIFLPPVLQRKARVEINSTFSHAFTMVENLKVLIEEYVKWKKINPKKEEKSVAARKNIEGEVDDENYNCITAVFIKIHAEITRRKEKAREENEKTLLESQWGNVCTLLMPCLEGDSGHLAQSSIMNASVGFDTLIARFSTWMESVEKQKSTFHLIVILANLKRVHRRLRSV